MSSNINSVANTLKIALILCAICSVVISGAAVILKPMQTANQILDRNRNILIAAGVYDPAVHGNADVESLFQRFTPRIVDLDSGAFLSEEQMSQLGLDPQSYDEAAARNDPALSDALSTADDTARVRRRAKYATVYTIDNADGSFESIVLPVSGYGLWGIMYGYLALEGDGSTVRGIGFYDHKETPGLGGEINNPSWQAQWPGKQVYGDNSDVIFQVVKGSGEGNNQVDGLSGATLTSRGVQNMITFWLGQRGFGPFLQNEVKG